MSRCQHCKKLTHSEDLYVTFKTVDFDKVHELIDLLNWTPKYMYDKHELEESSCCEFGKLKCGDIYIHFVSSQPKKMESQ